MVKLSAELTTLIVITGVLGICWMFMKKIKENYCDNCDTQFSNELMCDCEDAEYWELQDRNSQ